MSGSPDSRSRAIRLASSVCAVALASIAISCSDPAGPLDVTADYSLRTINGLALPYPLPQTDNVTITSGTLHLAADSSFASTLVYHADDGTTTQTDFGKYRVRGDTIDFIDDGHVFARGTASATSVTIDGLTGLFVYRK